MDSIYMDLTVLPNCPLLPPKSTPCILYSKWAFPPKTNVAGNTLAHT